MSDEKPIGAHGGGIPPGWDFPEAREAAEQGLDLWLLDSTLKQTPTQRLQSAANGARLIAMLRNARRESSGTNGT